MENLKATTQEKGKKDNREEIAYSSQTKILTAAREVRSETLPCILTPRNRITVDTLGASAFRREEYLSETAVFVKDLKPRRPPRSLVGMDFQASAGREIVLAVFDVAKRFR